MGNEARRCTRSKIHGREEVILTGNGRRAAGVTVSALLAWSLALPLPAAGEGDAVVHALLFASPTCPHCRKVLEEVLPPLLTRFGGRLRVGVLSTATPVGRDLYWAAHQRFAIRQRGVPLLVVGDFALVGSDEIPRRLPGLVAGYLAAGGVGWPEIPGLADVLAQSTAPPPSEPSPTVTAPGAHPQTPQAAALATPPVPQGPASAPLATPEPQPTSAPLATPAPPPTLEPGLAQVTTSRPRRAPRPAVPLHRPTAEAAPAVVPAVPAEPAAGIAVTPPRPVAPSAAVPPGLLSVEAGAESGLVDHLRADPYGNGLAVLVLLGMAAAVLRSAAVLRRDVPAARGSRLDALNPLLALAGLGVATYLAHVEVQDIEAVCGPVGDCNTVQQSEYARLFGVVPIGVLGVAGFAAILVGWGVRRFGTGRATAWASVALLALTGFGTLLSIYLTFLEPFVIGASCLWCLSSAVIMTALYGLAVAPGRAAAARIRHRPVPELSRHST
jgi:uncharacterized membrane protein